MKVCPRCNQVYDDNNLNFCLNDGELLMEQQTQDAPPTIMMDAPRQTNENWGNFDPGFSHQNQQIYQQPFGSPQNYPSSVGKDQTLAIITIILGAVSFVFSFCCYAGLLFGPIGLITGFVAMNNVNKNPDIYDGKGLAIAGMIISGVGLAFSLLLLLIAFLPLLLNGI